ncbi:hypothetical protein [Streptomyces sp. NPDC008141]|uniref:hypothetical protein n=1 Tax=Streptomyces sp. NPDC008141 TaxID=3364815 RepID=UPI0036E1AC5D
MIEKKKIVVADDNLNWGGQWPRLLQEAAQKDERYSRYTVTLVSTPEAMCERLERDPDVWLAVIDVDFARASRMTGLTALAAAERIAQDRPRGNELHTIVTTVEDTDDRILFLHTAFQCFGPPPVDLIYKDNDFTRTVLEAVGHLSTGGRSSGQRFAQFAPRSPGAGLLMHRLLGGARQKDRKDGKQEKEDAPGINLALWRALSGITAEEGDDAVRGVQKIQQATGIKSKHIYKYMDDAFAAAAEVATHMRFPPRALIAPPQQKRANDVIVALREFAAIHALFFQAPELDQIVERLLDPVRKPRRFRD